MHLKSLFRKISDEKSVKDYYSYDVTWDSSASNVNSEICEHIICLHVYPWRDAIIFGQRPSSLLILIFCYLLMYLLDMEWMKYAVHYDIHPQMLSAFSSIT